MSHQVLLRSHVNKFRKIFILRITYIIYFSNPFNLKVLLLIIDFWSVNDFLLLLEYLFALILSDEYRLQIWLIIVKIGLNILLVRNGRMIFVCGILKIFWSSGSWRRAWPISEAFQVTIWIWLHFHLILLPHNALNCVRVNFAL